MDFEDFRALNQETEDLFEVTMKSLKGSLKLIPRDHTIGLNLMMLFEDVKRYNAMYVHKVTECRYKDRGFVILLFEKHSEIRARHYVKQIQEVEPLLVFTLPHDIGRVSITRETLGEKISELLQKVDIDFPEFPKFSSMYYVAGDRPELVRKYLPKQLMKSMELLKSVSVEINGKWGLLRTGRNISKDELLLLASIGKDLVS